MVEKEFEKEASAGLKKRSLNEMFGKVSYSIPSLSYKGMKGTSKNLQIPISLASDIICISNQRP